MMDFGSRDYQEAWLANVIREVKENGWDGVLIDDVNANQRLHLGTRTLDRYPTAADQQRAMKSFLATVGPALTAKGILALPNIMVEWPDGPSIWSDWIRYTSGAVQEYWTKWGSASSLHFAGPDWVYRQSFLDLTQRAGKIYLAITYAPRNDIRSMTYARASFLLGWNGGGSALLFHPGAVDPWHDAWTIDLGAPDGRQGRGRSRLEAPVRGRDRGRESVDVVADREPRGLVRRRRRLAADVRDPCPGDRGHLPRGRARHDRHRRREPGSAAGLDHEPGSQRSGRGRLHGQGERKQHGRYRPGCLPARRPHGVYGHRGAVCVSDAGLERQAHDLGRGVREERTERARRDPGPGVERRPALRRSVSAAHRRRASGRRRRAGAWRARAARPSPTTMWAST